MQHQCAATAATGNDRQRPATTGNDRQRPEKASELPQRPLTTAMPLNGKEMIPNVGPVIVSRAVRQLSPSTTEATWDFSVQGPFSNDGALDLLVELADQPAEQRREVLERIFFRVRNRLVSCSLGRLVSV